jgi:DNA-directed RNA polymerase alpha subunit
VANSFDQEYQRRIDRVEQYAGRIILAIARGNAEQLALLCEEAIAASRAGVSERGGAFDVPLVEIGVHVRIANALEESLGIVTVGQLLATEQRELLKVPNFGDKALAALMTCVAQHAVRCQVRENQVRA